MQYGSHFAVRQRVLVKRELFTKLFVHKTFKTPSCIISIIILRRTMFEFFGPPLRQRLQSANSFHRLRLRVSLLFAVAQQGCKAVETNKS